MPRTRPFERFAQRYDDWFERHANAYLAEIRALKALLPPFRTAYEIGMGTGRFALPLGIRVGVEPARKMARVALARGAEVVLGVAERLPIKSGCADLALMVTTICFVDDPELAMSEAFRTLSRGGSLLIGMVDRESPLGKKYSEEKKENVFYSEANFYSTEEVVQMARRVGFTRFAFAQTLFSPLEDVSDCEPVKPGYGEGSFVAILCTKQ